VLFSTYKLAASHTESWGGAYEKLAKKIFRILFFGVIPVSITNLRKILRAHNSTSARVGSDGFQPATPSPNRGRMPDIDSVR